MKKLPGKSLQLFSGLIFFLVGCKSDKQGVIPEVANEIRFEKPAHFPEPLYNFKQNPVTKDGFELGRALFYEPKLSGDNSISCGFCHQQSAGFTHHGHSVSHGIFDQTGHRNSPPVMNLAWSRFFTWDGGVFDLDLFSIVPITNPIEMGEDIHRVLDKLKADPKYPPRFEKAFGSKEITSAKMYMALSQFMLMCVSANSKYDQWKTGKGASMTEEELSGYTLVQKKCGKCHSGELFTDGNFHNNGLGQGRLKEDLGRQAITLNLDDNRKFKVPSLRNLGYTAPYMHDGRFLTIDAVLNFYSGGVKDSPQLDSTLRHIGGVGIPLTNEEKQKIKVFLETLNEPAFKSKYELSEYAAFP